MREAACNQCVCTHFRLPVRSVEGASMSPLGWRDLPLRFAVMHARQSERWHAELQAAPAAASSREVALLAVLLAHSLGSPRASQPTKAQKTPSNPPRADHPPIRLPASPIARPPTRLLHDGE